jgi:hypothetical protein
MGAGISLCDGVQAAARQSLSQGINHQLEAAPQRAATTAREVLRGRIQELLTEVFGQQQQDQVGIQPTEATGPGAVGSRSMCNSDFSRLKASSTCQRSR